MKYTLNQREKKRHTFPCICNCLNESDLETSKLFVKYTVCAGIARAFKDIHIFLSIIVFVDIYGQDFMI